MLRFNFEPPSGNEKHYCDSIRDGDWIIYRCIKCPDYERKINRRTKEMKVKGSVQNIFHSGYSVPNEDTANLNNTN